jgi:ABC-type multidrug transport system fused ATPase/permease subunit
MSSNGNDNHFVDAAFNLLVIAGVLFGIFLVFKFVFHFIFSLMPIVVFYVIPFVAMSFLCGFLFFLSTAMFTDRTCDFRWLSVSFPIIAVILYAIVGAPQTEYKYTVHETAPTQVLKKPKEKEKPPEPPKVTVEPLIEWPKLYHFYQRFEDGLEKKYPWQSLTYDQADLAFVLWLSLFLGAPTVFWVFFAKAQQEEEDKRMGTKIAGPLEATLSEKDGRIAKLIDQNIEYKRTLTESQAEIERLRKRDEYLTKKEKEKAGTHKGVLDTDDF